VNHVQLAILPAAHTKEKAEDIALLLLVKGGNLYTIWKPTLVTTGPRALDKWCSLVQTHISVGTHGGIYEFGQSIKVVSTSDDSILIQLKYAETPAFLASSGTV
jgi:hypothetical protein